ncbi:hypothetical protein CHU98_g5408 [Xylaria longipes]|nr:hypothetical protein CHU98_g5408 [Xylaria longipes]
MSSMLKKTGGLSFKPKAGRRPGAGAASKPPTSTTSSAPTTRAPTTEPPSQASTPAASTPSTSAVVDSIETTNPPANEAPIPAEPLPTPATLQTPSTSKPHAEIPAVQITPTSEPAASPPPPPASPPVVQILTPQPSNEVRDSAPRSEPHRPATGLSRHDAQPTPSSETENSPPSTTDTLSQPSAATPAAASEPSAPEKEVTLEPPTASSSLPPVSTATATSPPSETAAPQPPAPKKQTPRRRKSTVTDGGVGVEGTAPKKKRQRTKSSTSTTAEAGEGARTEAPKPTRRRKRAPTPENAEELTVDHSTMTVGELTKDLGIGKRFRHAEEIEQRAREARAKYRLKKLERDKRKLGLVSPEDDNLALQQDTANENGESRGAAMAQLGASMESGAGQGVGYDVVDGQIVVHAASLIVNRHNQDMSNLEEVEENDFTNLVNSSSFAKRVQAPDHLLPISRQEPRAIKLKFNKEERLRPNRVNAAMMVRGQKKVNIDIEEYKATQRQWQAKDKILEEHARLAQEHERDVTRLREERRAAGLIDDDDQGAKKTTDTNANNGGFDVIEEDADALGQQGAQDDADVTMDAQPEGIQT